MKKLKKEFPKSSIMGSMISYINIAVNINIRSYVGDNVNYRNSIDYASRNYISNNIQNPVYDFIWELYDCNWEVL
jgi:hypothetical protein